MTLRFMLTYEDYIAFNVFHQKHNPFMQKQFRRGRLIVPVVMILYLLLLFLLSISSFLAVKLLLMVCAILWFLFYPKLYWSSLLKNIKAQIPDDGTNEFVGQRVLSLKEDSIRNEGDGRSSETVFRHVSKLAKTPQALYIYTGRISAFIVPIAGAEQPEHVDALLQLLQHKTGLQVEYYD